MKQQYQTRYEWLHESYQKWLTGFTRHAVTGCITLPTVPVSEAGSEMRMRTLWTRPFRC